MADNTARNLSVDQAAPEPSMEDILASIKRIIADDEAPKDGKSERERFTHPTQHSNSNTSAAADLSDSDVAAALKAELDQSSNVDDGKMTLEERAAKLRAEISAKGNAKSAEERLARFKSDSRLQMEELAARQTQPPISAAQPEQALSSADQADADRSPFAPPVMPRFNPMQTMMPTTDSVAREMAAVLMRDKGHELQAMLAEMMRPGISQWLSDNLPTIVEKLVREEIHSASRGGR